MNWSDIVWVGWLVYFVIAESYALFVTRKSGDTLSGHVWVWFGISKDQPANGWAHVRRVALLAFMVWLSIHFLSGGWV